jgi:ABC-type bacteriocin/lantibiotic exporter with double-glycine peptidase domain
MGLLSRFRRVRYIPQLEVVECGAASLAMVLDYHGASVPLVEVREACGIGRDGVNAARIVKAAEQLGLDAQGFRTELDGLHDLPCPAILHWEFNHFVVLERVRRRGAVIVDPACGRRVIDQRELGRAFTGIALAFTKSERLVPRAPESSGFGRYRAALRKHRGALTMVLGAALLLELCAVALPATSQVLIDHVLVPQRERWFWPLVAVFASTASVMLLLTALRDRVLRRLQFVIDAQLVTELVEHLLELPLLFFQQRAAGDLLQRADAQRQMRDVTMRAVTALLDGLLIVTYALLMIAYDPKLGAVALAASMLRMLVLLALRTRVQQAVATELTQRGRELGASVDALAVPEVVKAFGAEDAMLSQYEARLVERLETTVERERLSIRTARWGGLCDALAQAAILWLGGNAVITQDMTLGVFTSFVTLQALFQKPLQSMIEALLELSYARGALARIDDVLATAPAAAGTREVHALTDEITFDDVGYRYGPSSPWVCEHLSLTIRRGEKVAIVGRSGQGKSTFLKLLLGMISPSVGTLRIDGVPLAELDREAWLRHVGVVLQEPFFFHDTVRANLAMHDPNVSLERVRWAAQVACIDDVLQALPEGYDTNLGENARLLSGGQRQRLALARALCRQPSVLVLDEATSSLDRDTEARVHAHLGSLGCTRILIAHRLETVRDADRILVIEGGRIVQEGSYEALSRAPGLFQQMTHAFEGGAPCTLLPAT